MYGFKRNGKADIWADNIVIFYLRRYFSVHDLIFVCQFKMFKWCRSNVKYSDKKHKVLQKLFSLSQNESNKN